MMDKEKILEAFEECLCKSHNYCAKCYQQGPAIGMVCKNNVCIAILEMLRKKEENNDDIITRIRSRT